jgi:peptidoglycan glycosyltransferase
VDNSPLLDLPQTTADLPNENGRPCTSGTATLTVALENSCNVAFGKIGLELGANALRAQAQKFGFDRAFEVPIRSVASHFPEDPNLPQTAQSAIGQYDVRATPLQMAMVVAAIANRGVLMAPYLQQEVRGPDLSIIETTKPRALGASVSPQTAAELTEMMVKVVEQGTGTNGQIPGVAVAGKTGTAQTGGGRSPHAWFVSFAPANDPQVAVAVIVENGGGVAEVTGNQVAGPIANDVMRAVLKK